MSVSHPVKSAPPKRLGKIGDIMTDAVPVCKDNRAINALEESLEALAKGESLCIKPMATKPLAEGGAVRILAAGAFHIVSSASSASTRRQPGLHCLLNPQAEHAATNRLELLTNWRRLLWADLPARPGCPPDSKRERSKPCVNGTKQPRPSRRCSRRLPHCLAH